MGGYLFGKTKLSGYIGTMLKKIGIDVGMAINYFLHSVALTLDENKKHNEQSVVNLAHDMGHSIMTHLRYTSHNLVSE